MVVEGTLARAASAFNVKFSHYEASDAFIGSPVRYRGHSDLHMPADLDGVVVSVFGLDNQPRVIPMFRRIEGQPQIVYTPPDFGELYVFPAETDGTGQTLAIVTVTGGYHQQDVDAYFAQLGLPSSPSITVVSVNGVQNAPGLADQPLGRPTLRPRSTSRSLARSSRAARIVNYFTPNTGLARSRIDAGRSARQSGTYGHQPELGHDRKLSFVPLRPGDGGRFPGGGGPGHDDGRRQR